MALTASYVQALADGGQWHVVMACRDFSKAEAAARRLNIPKDAYTVRVLVGHRCACLMQGFLLHKVSTTGPDFGNASSLPTCIECLPKGILLCFFVLPFLAAALQGPLHRGSGAIWRQQTPSQNSHAVKYSTGAQHACA